ncbi:DUF4265 domain-containing protein [Streptomyces sp. NPDC059928]|uniref:DUF4265 domain-containing protein n=1 Tax=unclassified Streptomyces TaxID=2593676 RepID=UPI003664E49A
MYYINGKWGRTLDDSRRSRRSDPGRLESEARRRVVVSRPAQTDCLPEEAAGVAVCERFSEVEAGAAFGSSPPPTTLDIPPTADLPRIRKFLKHGEAQGWWHWEGGRVTTAWTASDPD